MDQVLSAERGNGKIVLYIIDQDGKKHTIAYLAIRCGLSFPVPGRSPGVAVFFAERRISFESNQRRIKLLAEVDRSELSMGLFFNLITDTAARLGCNAIFTDVDEENTDNLKAFHDFCYTEKASVGRLREAPYAGYFAFGISILKEWVSCGQLEIESGNMVHEELKRITHQDLAEHPEVRFPAINALRFGIGSLYKNPPTKKKKRRRVLSAMVV